MKTAQQWFDEYGVSHQNRFNKLVHWFCVPAIFFSVVGLLWSIPIPAAFSPFPYLNWATISLALVLIFYFRMSWQIALGMVLFSAACMMLSEWITHHSLWPLWQVSIAVFVVAWIFQFVGHQVEGKRPSFFKDVQFLLIGPAWLLGFIYRRMHIRY